MADVSKGSLILSTQLNTRQGWKLVARNCIAQIQRSARHTLDGDDPESVHQLRVGLRRLRCAGRLFSKCVAMPVGLKEELRWLASHLGDVREWQVLDSATLPPITLAAPPDFQLSAVQTLVHASATRKTQQLKTILASDRFRALLTALDEWQHHPAAPLAHPTAVRRGTNTPLRPFADKQLARAFRQLSKELDVLDETDTQSCHQVRIAAKQVRYGTEFFASLHQHGQRRTAALNLLQRWLALLGRMNDDVVAEAQLRALLTEHAALTPSIEFARGYLQRDLEVTTRQFIALRKDGLKRVAIACGAN